MGKVVHCNSSNWEAEEDEKLKVILLVEVLRGQLPKAMLLADGSVFQRGRLEAAGATGATSLASLLSLHLFCLRHFALAKDKMASQVLPLCLVLCLGTLGHFLMLQRYPWVNQLLIQSSNLPKF